jgi:Raf kinase inhibitor-like YbhB/YbcL family protein
MRGRRALAAGAVLASLVGCSSSGGGEPPTPEVPVTIAITSPAFANGDPVPRRFTCDGADVSPPLTFAHVPPGAAELALVVEDPDAPRGTFVHWLAWGLDPHRAGLGEGEAAPASGTNGFGSRGYRGPCPPKGKPHRYVFTVFALDARLDLTAGASAEQLRKAIGGHTLARGTLTGRYGR